MKNPTIEPAEETIPGKAEEVTLPETARANRALPADAENGSRPASSRDRVEIDDQDGRVLLDKYESHEVRHTEAAVKRGVTAYPGRIILVLVLVAGLVAAGFFLLSRKKNSRATETTTPAAEAPAGPLVLTPEQRAAVAVEVVERRTLQAEVTAPGKVAFNGNRVSPVFSQFNGRLVRLDAEVGTSVRAGQVIGMIDTPDIVATQADYQQALTNERSARTALDLATRTRARAERLAAAEAIPLRDLQQAQADESHARDDLTRAQSAVAAARGRLQSAGMSESEIGNITAGARPVNRLVPLTAPLAGVITDRKAGLGQVVQPAAGDPLFMVADLSSVWVNADVYEDQLSKIRVGAPVKIQTPAYPSETFAARVDQIGATLDPDKHTVAVRCVVPNRGDRLKPGMFASIILSSAAPQSVLTVPASAILTEGNNRLVLVEEAPGRYVKRTVETGNESEGSVVVLAGLEEGDRVVVRGALLVSAQQEGN